MFACRLQLFQFTQVYAIQNCDKVEVIKRNNTRYFIYCTSFITTESMERCFTYEWAIRKKYICAKHTEIHEIRTEQVYTAAEHLSARAYGHYV